MSAQEKAPTTNDAEQEKELKQESSKQEIDKRLLIEKLKKMQALLAKAKEALDIKSRALGEATSENEKLKKTLNELKECEDSKAQIAELQQRIAVHRKDADVLQIKNAALENELTVLRKKTADNTQELSTVKQSYDQATADIERFKRALAEKDKVIQEQLLAQESSTANHRKELESMSQTYQEKLSALDKERQAELNAAEQRFEAQLNALSDEHRRSSEESVAHAETQLREQFARDNLQLLESMKKQEADSAAALEQLKITQEEFSNYKLKTRSIAAEKLELLKTNDELQNQVQKYSTTIKQLSVQLENANAENQSMKTDFENCKADLERLKSSSAKYQDEAGTLRDKLEQWKTKAAAAEEELGRIKIAVEQNQKEYKDMKASYAEREQKFMNDFELMKTEQEAQNNEQSALKEKNDSLEHEVAELKKSLESIKATNLQLTKENELLKTENQKSKPNQNTSFQSHLLEKHSGAYLHTETEKLQLEKELTQTKDRIFLLESEVVELQSVCRLHELQEKELKDQIRKMDGMKLDAERLESIN